MNRSSTVRPAKRRRLSSPSSASDGDTDYGDDLIDIPKNAELPEDVFSTQPPERFSSPYRIDQSQWPKPQIQDQVPTWKPAAVKQPTSRNPHVSTMSDLTIKGGKHSSDGQMSKDLLFQSNADDFDVDVGYEEMLADLPLDAFSSPTMSTKETNTEPILINSQQDDALTVRRQGTVAPHANLKQTTLFGTHAPSVTQSKRKHNWPMANREEPPTHHKIDRAAMKTWVFPTNLGTIRDYQYSIVSRGLYHNMLVALPTGLGKTFIAATIMLNWFRWTTDAQIVFVAPTRPLVSQQVKACFEIAGIPRSVTAMLTGNTSPGLRAEVWQSKRVFFMTPQTLINDLKTGICDPKRLVLIVVDEAHRATGGYAYVEVVNFVMRFNTSFRVLALTATPGASIESVQEVIDGLQISRVEIRTEESLDIRQYVHSRRIETVLFDNSDEMVMVMDLFSKALQPVLDKLIGINAYWTRDPMSLTPYGCMQARQRWYASEAGRKAPKSLKGMVMTIFGLLASLSHAIELLKFHGIGPFYHKALSFRNNLNANGKSGDKYGNQINASQPFETMMSRVRIWMRTPDFVGHPKLEYLQRVVMNHFLDAGEGRGASDQSSTRIMIFSHYRDSAEEIARVLKRDDTMIRPHVFVGQASTRGSDGMDQKTQLDIIEKFKLGTYNTLVATSIGEEGLDIGEVDLIVCYDASASPIRMLQRMGRTGRKRAGNIVVTLMKGKEENNFVKAKDNYEKMQLEIASGNRFNFHDERSRRIVPRDIQPVVDKRVIDIPLENTQADLPEPIKKGRPPKRPPKKFHMPDGVRMGFVKASRLDEDETEEEDDKDTGELGRGSITKQACLASPARIPSLDKVLLTSTEESLFERRYLDIGEETSQIVEAPRLNAFPGFQRNPRPVKHIGHGQATKRVVKALGAMHAMTEERARRYGEYLLTNDREEGKVQAEKRARSFKETSEGTLAPVMRTYEAMAIPSSEELNPDKSLQDLVEDERNDATSSKSSPPSLTLPEDHLYHSQNRT
ncbi:MAG: hypothetical protein Q9163_000663, partial [Psora crenata]